jgi:signal transduction histidine kinase
MKLVEIQHPPATPSRRWRGSRPYWLAQFIGWTGVALLVLVPLPFRANANWLDAAAILIFCVTGIAFSHLLRASIIDLLVHVRTVPSLVLRATPRVFGFAFLHGCVQLLFVRAMEVHSVSFLSSRPGIDSFAFTVLDLMSFSFGLFVIWASLYFLIRIYQNAHRIQLERLRVTASIHEAALGALKAQLNPHLLFNCLNTIRALIPREASLPRDAITHLSELLRSSLSFNELELIPLREELATVENYLALERLRFEDRLRFTRQIDDAALTWPVPPFTLQTLVENAVKYGVATRENGGNIHLSIRVTSGLLEILVINDGQLSTGTPSSTGLGIRNLANRIALLHGPGANIHLRRASADRVEASILLPKPLTKLPS